MVRGHSDIVGLVVASIDDPYFALLASGVLTAVNRHHLQLNLALTERDPDHEIELIESFRGQRARAIVMTSSRSSSTHDPALVRQELEKFRASGGGVCLIGTPDWGLPTVPVAHREAGRLMVERLAALGYRDLLLLGGPPEVHTAAERAAGVLEAAAAHHISTRVEHSSFSLAGGAEATAAVLADGGRPDGIVAVGELMAIGAAQAVRSAGLRLPEDVGLAAFDDTWVSTAAHPALTSVAFPVRELGERAVEIALGGSEATRTDDEQPITGQFVLRESTPVRN